MLSSGGLGKVKSFLSLIGILLLITLSHFLYTSSFSEVENGNQEDSVSEEGEQRIMVRSMEAEGVGYSPLGANTQQMKLLARRGAVVDAQRNLLALLAADDQGEGILKGAVVVEGSEVFFQLEDGRMGCTLKMTVETEKR